MDIDLLVTTLFGAFMGFLGVWWGEFSAGRRWRDERESRRWSEIMACIRIVETPGEPARLKEVAARRLIALQGSQQTATTTPTEPHMEPSILVPGGGTIDPRAPGGSSVGYEFTTRPAWERMKSQGRKYRFVEAIIIAMASAGAAAALHRLMM